MLRSWTRPVATVGALLVVGLLVFVPASASATSASATPASTVSASTWSYGVLKTVHVGPDMASNGWVYEGNATLGYTVTI